MYVYKLMTRSYRLCYKVTSLSKCILIYWQGLHSGKSPSSNSNEIIGIVGKVLGSGGGLQKNLGHIERTSGSLELSAVVVWMLLNVIQKRVIHVVITKLLLTLDAAANAVQKRLTNGNGALLDVFERREVCVMHIREVRVRFRIVPSGQAVASVDVVSLHLRGHANRGQKHQGNNGLLARFAE